DLIVEGQGNGPTVRQQLTASRDGWFETFARGIGPGARYRFCIDDELDVPDPASRFQPEGVAGPAEVVDPQAFVWAQSDWRGREWHEAVLYELHVGTFTREGTYSAAISRLDDLARL